MRKIEIRSLRPTTYSRPWSGCDPRPELTGVGRARTVLASLPSPEWKSAWASHGGSLHEGARPGEGLLLLCEEGLRVVHLGAKDIDILQELAFQDSSVHLRDELECLALHGVQRGSVTPRLRELQAALRRDGRVALQGCALQLCLDAGPVACGVQRLTVLPVPLLGTLDASVHGVVQLPQEEAQVGARVHLG
eukprot:scaffold7378_cov410-Prasinococcus_capsulatus_cf.AAC.16